MQAESTRSTGIDWKKPMAQSELEFKMPDDLQDRVVEAVRSFWEARAAQRDRQRSGGASNQGARGDVVGGKQMDGFALLLVDLMVEAGVRKSSIFVRPTELPGFFRPTKDWDVVVVRDGNLIAAVELKSQVGSLGNNFNNRVEEALGSSVDLWTAYREGQFQTMPRPFVGYLLLLEDSERARSAVKVREPHFSVRSEFTDISYMRRYELFCRKLVLEGCYTAAGFLTAARVDAEAGPNFAEPASDLTVARFVEELIRHTTP